MSRGHKILQTFLQKRGAWDNNPYKEPEMKKPEPPFEPDKNPKKFAVAGKAGYGPSAARHLARKGLEQMSKLNPKLKETWSHAILDQLAEVHPAVMAMAKVAGQQSLKAQADKHTEMAMAANRAGDDEKVRHHQAQVAKIKAQMQNAQSEGYIDFTRPSGAAYDAKMVKGKMVISPAKQMAVVPAKKKDTKLSMSQAAGALAAEAVTYTGMGTDVVDKKKKLNPQPNLMMKPKQVKDFKEENLDELKASTLQSYADKAHQQALDATYDAAHLNRTGEEKFKAAAKRLASKRAGGVQLAQTKMDRKYNAAGDAYRAHTGINSNKQLYNKEALELPHSMGDTVRCTRTQRMATVAGFDNDKYTVVYGDGSTETGAADYWTTVHKVNQPMENLTNEACTTPVNYSLYKGRRLHFCGSKGKSSSSRGGPASDAGADADGGAGDGGGGDGGV
jgi:hypothetical protein